MMFEGLAAEIRSLNLRVDGDALAEALALYDELGARLTEALGAFDAAELWELDGATSLTGWLAERARLSRRRAAGWALQARKLTSLPVTLQAYLEGVLSGGQVEAICSHLSKDTVQLFAKHEAELVPALAGLAAEDAAGVMARRRDEATDREPTPERSQELHLSRGLDNQWLLDANLNAETGELLDTALRLATTNEVEGDTPRSNGTRRADRPDRPADARSRSRRTGTHHGGVRGSRCPGWSPPPPDHPIAHRRPRARHELTRRRGSVRDLVELDEVAGRVGEERLAARPHARGVAHLDAPLPEIGDGAVEVVDQQGEVLAERGRSLGLEQVDLLATSVEPRPTEPEVRSVRAGAKAQHLRVEGQRRVDVVHVDRHVVHSEWSHEPSLALSETERAGQAPRRSPSMRSW